MVITRIVLSAGRSSRMGRPKALLEFGPKTAMDLIAALSPPTGFSMSTIIVTGFHHDEIAAKAYDLGWKVVRNENFDRGQTSSLKCGLREVGTDSERVLLHPIDCPLVTNADYRACFEAVAAHRSTDLPPIVIASREMRRGHPVILPNDVAARMLQLGDDEPARGIWKEYASRINHVTVENPWVVRDLDTPEDYAAARAHLGI